MRWRYSFFLGIFFHLALGLSTLCGSGAERGLERAFHAPGRLGGWELLWVDPAPSGESLKIADARGGLRVGRHFSQRGLISLPQVEPPAGGWKVVITPDRGSEQGSDQGPPTAVLLPEPPPQPARLRILVGMTSPQVPDVSSLGLVEMLRVPEHELLDAPPLALCGADGIWLDESLAAQISSSRAASLVAVGLKLFFSGPTPPAGALENWLWDRSAGGLWIAPREWRQWTAMPSLAPRGLSPPDRIPRRVWWLLAAVVPIALMGGLQVLPRGYRLGLGVGLCVGLYWLGSLKPQCHEWVVRYRDLPGQMSLEDHWGVVTWSQPGRWEMDRPPLPLIGDRASWFALRASLELESHRCRLVGEPGQRVYWFSRRAIPMTPQALGEPRRQWESPPPEALGDVYR